MNKMTTMIPEVNVGENVSKELLPKTAEHVDIIRWHYVLKRGDHILVRRDTSNDEFHHAIFVGEKMHNNNLDDYVVDMHGFNAKNAKIRMSTLHEFLTVKGGGELAVLNYNNDDDRKREKSARLAEESYKRITKCTALYKLLNCKCDNFASWCRTMKMDPVEIQAIAVEGRNAAQRLPQRQHGTRSLKFAGHS
jgi:hypothetical protein